MPIVSYVHPDLRARIRDYDDINDCLQGERVVKYRGAKHLPMPNAEDRSPANVARYSAYIQRAVFYNVTARTLRGMVGEVMARDPEIKVPTQLKPIIDDATGLGVSSIQLTRHGVSRNTAFGRGGFFTDYPRFEGGASAAQVAAGVARPTIVWCEPWDVINWRWVSNGAAKKLSLVVLRERYIRDDELFQVSYGTQFRVLRLDDAGEYVQEIYRDDKSNSTIGTVKPTDASGKAFDYIPFEFVGSENNDPNVDPAPLYDIASLNLAHYRNSADYEEACYMVGQPTPWFAGLTADWVTNVWGGKIMLGSRSAVPLPPNASAGLIQAQANGMALEAMKHKEEQMISLGAKLIMEAEVSRTATEANIDKSAETSTLSVVAKNTSAAYQESLATAARFMGATDKIEYKLNSEFDLIKLSADEARGRVDLWVREAITFGEMRSALRQAGIAELADDEAARKIKEEAPMRPGLGLEVDDGEGDDPPKKTPTADPPQPAA